MKTDGEADLGWLKFAIGLCLVEFLVGLEGGDRNRSVPLRASVY